MARPGILESSEPNGRHACRSDANDREEQQQQCIIHANELQYQDDVSTGALIRYMPHFAACVAHRVFWAVCSHVHLQSVASRLLPAPNHPGVYGLISETGRSRSADAPTASTQLTCNPTSGICSAVQTQSSSLQEGGVRSGQAGGHAAAPEPGNWPGGVCLHW